MKTLRKIVTKYKHN